MVWSTQPLYVEGLNIPRKGRHSVVFVATEGDSVYAFDADAAGPTLWQRNLAPAGEAPVPIAAIQNCDNIEPQIGITSTPVIDRATGTLYVVAKTMRDAGGATSFHQRLHALDLATGADKPGSPVELAASVAGTGDGHDGAGQIPFNPQWQLNRPVTEQWSHLHRVWRALRPWSQSWLDPAV